MRGAAVPDRRRPGRLDDAGLRRLSAVLRESPQEADRAAARDLDDLAVRSRLGDPAEPDDAGNAGQAMRKSHWPSFDRGPPGCPASVEPQGGGQPRQW
jgi:hypothetical protein